MGVNNKRRRAAKRRKYRSGSSQSSGSQRRDRPAWDPVGDAFAEVEHAVWVTLRLLADRRAGQGELLARVDNLERRFAGERHVLEAVVTERLCSVVAATSAGGWGPADLDELVRRHCGPQHLAALAAALERGVPPSFPTTRALTSALQVAALLSTAPLLRAETAAPAPPAAHPKLAKVRALLAKAESTPFEEEAEALSAKAQELIARYALERFVAQGSARSEDNRPQMRRLWLDTPYVLAKASLVHAVASANRCRAAGSKQFGFSVVVGAVQDLDAVELLVTSLLVQADVAMLRHASRARDAARTRSFRQSFLLAYADRIGERLRLVNEQAVSTSEADRLLPALLEHDAAVTDAFEAMVPHQMGAGPSVTSAEGWSAGTVAADLARLEVHGHIAGKQRATPG